MLTGPADSERVVGAAVDDDLLTTLGVRPLLGRGITSGEMGQQPAPFVVIGYEVWQRRFWWRRAGAWAVNRGRWRVPIP